MDVLYEICAWTGAVFWAFVFVLMVGYATGMISVRRDPNDTDMEGNG